MMKPAAAVKSQHPLAMPESRAAFLHGMGFGIEVDCCKSWIAATVAAAFFHSRRCTG